MAWTVDELKRWLDEIEPRIDALDHFAWLELTTPAPYDDVQPAFHRVARTRHPDLFRTRIDAAEMDRLVRVYARITSAYAELRDPQRYDAIVRPLRQRLAPPRTRTPVGSRAPDVARTRTPTSVPRTLTPASIPRTQTPTSIPRTQTPASVPRTQTQPSIPRTQTPLPTRSPTEPPAELEPSRAMNARALAYYRRAEGALRVGDRTTALLHLRMALASDPTSPLLRAALVELLANG